MICCCLDPDRHPEFVLFWLFGYALTYEHVAKRHMVVFSWSKYIHINVSFFLFRKRSSESLTSSGSDTPSLEQRQANVISPHPKHENLDLLSSERPSSSSQTSRSSTDSDSKHETGVNEKVLTQPLFLRNLTVPALQIEAAWISAHVTCASSPSKFYVSCLKCQNIFSR